LCVLSILPFLSYIFISFLNATAPTQIYTLSLHDALPIYDLDIKMLNILQANARTKRNQLAEAVGLSIPSVSERLNKLEENGVIEGFYTKLNKKIFGYEIGRAHV